METIKKIINKPAPWIYFVLVVALLVIVTRNSGTINDLRADLDSVNAEVSTLEALNETTLEAMANEVAVRDDAITGLNNAIAGWEADSVDVNARLNQVDAERGDLEVQVVDLTARLDASASALDASASALDASTLALTDAIANPICSACPECPVVTE
jgi:chromosome segregation ATPase|tara:strand:- start:2376 stop:2846 length:471 start_codon:yes stop_codon:yes gene_type:complete